MDNWLIWLIFGLLLAALVGFLVFTFIRDKLKNKKLAQKRAELKRATIKSSKQLAIRIYTMIEESEKLVQSVRPGESKLKMKHVNKTSRDFLKNIYDSKAFKTIYIDSSESDPKFSLNLKTLIDRNSNLWFKYNQEEIKYFKNFHDELKEDEKFLEIKQDALNIIYDEFLEKAKNE